MPIITISMLPSHQIGLGTKMVAKMCIRDSSRPVMITTRDIDREVADISRMIGYAVNMALHPHLTVSDIDLYLS